jgi:hypothetical protein
MRARPSSALALLAAVLVIALALARAQSCPALASVAKAKVVGRTVKAAVLIRNQGTSFVKNVVLRLGLPPPTDVIAVKTAASPVGTKGVRVQTRRAGNSVFFLNIALRPGQKRKFLAKGTAVNCDAKTLNFTALTYLDDPTSGAASCPSPTRTISVYSPGAHRLKRCTPRTLSPTPSGSNGTDVGFEIVGVGERCLEAGTLAPFTDGRRRSSRRELAGWPLASSASRRPRDDNEQRLLQPAVIESPSDCYVYCSNFGGTPPPFYFNWNTATSQCFCCGAICTLIYDPEYIAFLVTEPAPALNTSSPTLAPTGVPSASPSLRPTALPTDQPTKAPSASPTGAPTSPTASPSASPTASPSSTPTNAPSASPTQVIKYNRILPSTILIVGSHEGQVSELICLSCISRREHYRPSADRPICF